MRRFKKLPAQKSFDFDIFLDTTLSRIIKIEFISKHFIRTAIIISIGVLAVLILWNRIIRGDFDIGISVIKKLVSLL